MCSWTQEEIWKISSNVPRPPGKTMKASTWLNIEFIWLDVMETCSSLQLFFQWCPPLLKLWGRPPKLDYLLKIQLLTPLQLTQGCLPHILNEASTWPRWFVDSKNSFSFLRLDPPKTQIFLMWWLEEPIISTHFYIYWMYGLSRNEGKEEKIL